LTQNSDLPYTPGNRKRVPIISPQATEDNIFVPSGIIGGSQNEEVGPLSTLGERLAKGLRETYDMDALKEVCPVAERGD
jgi:hypothetical protein